jgi:hypothetical protein
MHVRTLLPALLLLNACAAGAVQVPPPAVPSARTAAVAADLRQALVAEVSSNPSLPGELLHVLAPPLASTPVSRPAYSTGRRDGRCSRTTAFASPA